MSGIQLAPETGADFERIFQHLSDADATHTAGRIQDIIDAIDVLERNPLIGRLVNDGKREFVIGRGARGYVALYRYEAALDTVLVLGIRGQKEAGYSDPQV